MYIPNLSDFSLDQDAPERRKRKIDSRKRAHSSNAACYNFPEGRAFIHAAPKLFAHRALAARMNALPSGTL